MLKQILPCTPSGNMLVLQVGTQQLPLPLLPSLEGASRLSLCRCPHRFQQRLGLGQRSLKDLVIARGAQRATDTGTGVKRAYFSPSSLLENPETWGRWGTFTNIPEI